MGELFANSGDPDQTPRSALSDLGLHCLPVTRLGVSSLPLVNHYHSQGRFSSRHIDDIFLVFHRKIDFDISCKLSPLHEMSRYIS